MKLINSIQLLCLELEKMKQKKDFSEKWFAEKGGSQTLKEYCEALELIEDYEQALSILKNHINGKETV